MFASLGGATMQTRRELIAGLAAGAAISAGAAKAQTASYEPHDPFRILSIDGGGLKGVIPATTLERMETVLRTATGKGVVDSFDMFAGTSTGAIIAAGL